MMVKSYVKFVDGHPDVNAQPHSTYVDS